MQSAHLEKQNVTHIGIHSLVLIFVPVLVDGGVRLHVGAEHRLVDARVRTIGAFEWFCAKMVAEVVFQVVLVFGDKRTLGTAEHFLRLDVRFGVSPKVLLSDGDKLALLALEHFDLALCKKILIKGPKKFVTKHLLES